MIFILISFSAFGAWCGDKYGKYKTKISALIHTFTPINMEQNYDIIVIGGNV